MWISCGEYKAAFALSAISVIKCVQTRLGFREQLMQVMVQRLTLVKDKNSSLFFNNVFYICL